MNSENGQFLVVRNKFADNGNNSEISIDASVKIIVEPPDHDTDRTVSRIGEGTVTRLVKSYSHYDINDRGVSRIGSTSSASSVHVEVKIDDIAMQSVTGGGQDVTGGVKDVTGGVKDVTGVVKDVTGGGGIV